MQGRLSDEPYAKAPQSVKPESLVLGALTALQARVPLLERRDRKRPVRRFYDISGVRGGARIHMPFESMAIKYAEMLKVVGLLQYMRTEHHNADAGVLGNWQ